MTAITTAIVALEQELAGLDDKRGQIEHALTALRRLEGEGLTPVGRPSRARRPTTEHPAAARSATRASGAPARGAATALEMRIAQVLQHATVPMKPKDLAATAKTSMFSLRAALQSMTRQKLVTVTGTTVSRRVALAGTAPKEGLRRR